MVRLNTWQSAIGFLLLTGFLGCGWGGESDDEFLAEFPEMAGTPVQEANAPPTDNPASTTESIRLNLKVGDRFPLIKTVQQTLAQPTSQGLIESTSRLEILLTMTVEEIREGSNRFSVRYQRVRYSRKMGDDEIEFDSSQPADNLPLEVVSYQGMVDNGFSFWVGADNRIVELVGFQDFLKRCLQRVPVEQRQQVLHALASTAGDDGIANFVDDSIGLLPYNVEGNAGQTAVAVGDSWSRRRQVVQPIPMVLDERYLLRELSEEVAQVDVLGTVAPSTTFGPPDQTSSGTAVSVRGGHCFGNCVIDRKTGLPIRSEIERYIDMAVTLADGQEFEQRKHILTTIRAFPQQSKPTLLGAAGPNPEADSSSPQPDILQSTVSDRLQSSPTRTTSGKSLPTGPSLQAASYGGSESTGSRSASSGSAGSTAGNPTFGPPANRSVASARYSDNE